MIRMQTWDQARIGRRVHQKDTFDGFVTDFILADEAVPAQAFLVEQKPNWVTPPHFHLEHQFQVVTAGRGRSAGTRSAPVRPLRHRGDRIRTDQRRAGRRHLPHDASDSRHRRVVPAPAGFAGAHAARTEAAAGARRRRSPRSPRPSWSRCAHRPWKRSSRPGRTASPRISYACRRTRRSRCRRSMPMADAFTWRRAARCGSPTPNCAPSRPCSRRPTRLSPSIRGPMGSKCWCCSSRATRWLHRPQDDRRPAPGAQENH